MTKITYTTTDGTVIAQGVLGQDIHEFEGNYYFDKQSVRLDVLAKQENAYHCPIKNSDCDYYYITNDEGFAIGTEIGWIYETINNTLFKDIEGKFGMYNRSNEDLTQTKEEI